MAKKKIRIKPQAEVNTGEFIEGKRYVFSRRKYIDESWSNREEYKKNSGWIKQIRGVVFTYNGSMNQNPEIDGFGVVRNWCTEIR